MSDEKTKRLKEILLIAIEVIGECEYSLTKNYNNRIAEAIEKWEEVENEAYKLISDLSE